MQVLPIRPPLRLVQPLAYLLLQHGRAGCFHELPDTWAGNEPVQSQVPRQRAVRLRAEARVHAQSRNPIQPRRPV